jgi:hypothetical protein
MVRLGELLQTPHHFASGTTDYVTPLSHNQSAKNPYHTLPQQLHYYHYSNYILSTTTIKASLSLIPFLIIYISSYTLHERIVWPISPQFEHFDGALFLIICWSDVLLIWYDVSWVDFLGGNSGNRGLSIGRYSDTSLPRPSLQNWWISLSGIGCCVNNKLAIRWAHGRPIVLENILVQFNNGASGVALLAILACSEIRRSEYRDILFVIFE